MPITPRKLLFIVIGISVMGAVGITLLGATYDVWSRGQILLTRHRIIPRLVTYATDPVEFTLRCTFLGLGASLLASFAFIGLLGIVHRFAVLRSQFFSAPFESKIAVRLMVIPLVCFVGWVALLAFLPIAYD